MALKLTGLFRRDALLFNPNQAMGKGNAGGGLAVKSLYLEAALPKLELISDISQIGSVNIAEALWFSHGGESIKKNVELYASKTDTFKILWTSDFEVLRWTGENRQLVFDSSDVVCGNSPYMVNILKAYHHNVALLTDPIDCSMFSPLVKQPVLTGMSQVMIHKNIDTIINVFKGLPNTIRTQFIGSPNMWGMPIKEVVAQELDNYLHAVAHDVIPGTNRSGVATALGHSWAYITDSGFDTFCYAMVESMLCGCWCFCGQHPVFKDRPCIKFSSPVDAIQKIDKFFEEHPPGTSINEEGRQFVIDNYSLEVFRNQFHELVGGQIL